MNPPIHHANAVFRTPGPITPARIAAAIEAYAKELLAEIGEKDRRDLVSDSIVASCNCHTKSPDAEMHEAGCKYRLIVERNAARSNLARLIEEAKKLIVVVAEVIETDAKATAELSALGIEPDMRLCQKLRAEYSSIIAVL